MKDAIAAVTLVAFLASSAWQQHGLGRETRKDVSELFSAMILVRGCLGKSEYASPPDQKGETELDRSGCTW